MLHYNNLRLNDIKNEIWKDVKGYEGKYMISNLGRVKSLKRQTSGGVWYPERILKQMPELKHKAYYLVVSLHNGGLKRKKVHQLVGIAFIPNPKNKKTINHKWGNTLDNRASELEWNTQSENALHAFRVLGRKPNKTGLGKFGKLHPGAKKIKCITNGMTFDCATDAARHFKIDISLISMVCNGKLQKTHGLSFKYL
jgi:NUMOD4 motif